MRKVGQIQTELIFNKTAKSAIIPPELFDNHVADRSALNVHPTKWWDAPDPVTGVRRPAYTPLSPTRMTMIERRGIGHGDRFLATFDVNDVDREDGTRREMWLIDAQQISQPAQPGATKPSQGLAAQQTLPGQHRPPEVPNTEGCFYGITLDIDIDSLKTHYGEPYNDAYREIREVLLKQGFTWRQRGVYFGGESINAVTCVLAAIELARVLPWFAASVRDIRMLRIEEFNDLMPAVQQATPGP